MGRDCNGGEEFLKQNKRNKRHQGSIGQGKEERNKELQTVAMEVKRRYNIPSLCKRSLSSRKTAEGKGKVARRGW